MKTIFTLALAFMIAGISMTRAQDSAGDAATQESYQKLLGRVQDLSETVELQRKRIDVLETELKALREEQGKPNTNVADRDELRQLAEKVKEIDEKRAADKEVILKEISKLGKTSAASGATKVKVEPKAAATAEGNYEGFEYVFKEGDTLSKVVAAYREKGVKVTVAQVLKHPLNAKLDPNKIAVGQKVFIPGTK